LTSRMQRWKVGGHGHVCVASACWRCPCASLAAVWICGTCNKPPRSIAAVLGASASIGPAGGAGGLKHSLGTVAAAASMLGGGPGVSSGGAGAGARSLTAASIAGALYGSWGDCRNCPDDHTPRFLGCALHPHPLPLPSPLFSLPHCADVQGTVGGRAAFWVATRWPPHAG